MRQPSRLTDNTNLTAKAKLRVKYLPAGDTVKVLDAFHGSGLCWQRVQELRPDVKIQITAIDKKPAPGIYLVGDNVRFLKQLDLSAYDVLDFDGYGFPYRQLVEAFKNRRSTGRRVFVTTGFGMSQSGLSSMSSGLYFDQGYTSDQLEKAAVCVRHDPWQKVKRWLGLLGVRELVTVWPSLSVAYSTFEMP